MGATWFLTVVLSLATTLVACSSARPDPPQVVKLEAHGPRTTVVSVGDILLADAAHRALEQHGYRWPFERVAPLLAEADVVLGNLEGPVTTHRERAFPGKKWSYRMPAKAARALATVGFDVVCLANNHILDYGSRGVADTIVALNEVGIRWFGAGRNEREARRGLVLDVGGFRIGLLGYYQRHLDLALRGGYAGEDHPGPAMLTEDVLEADLKRLRTHADVLIVNFHWGANYRPVSKYQRRMGHRAIDLGADIVNGHHPHIAQGIEIYRGKPIVYSVGNFTFGTPGRFPRGKQGYGLVVRYIFEKNALRFVVATPIAVNNALVKFQPHRVPAAEARSALEPELAEFQTSARWLGDTAVITVGTPGTPPLPFLP